MRYKILLAILFCVASFSCNDDDYPYAEIPSVVLNSFGTQYPKATAVAFKKTEGGYEAEFEKEEEDVKVYLNSTGIVLREKEEIQWNDLPTEVRKSIQEKYGAENIQDPEVIRSGNKTYYQIKIKKFLFDDKLVLNENGDPSESLNYWD